jgi:hypothetical protein
MLKKLPAAMARDVGEDNGSERVQCFSQIDIPAIGGENQEHFAKI